MGLTGAGAQSTFHPLVAGWSSLVARQAHNLKVAGSNPAPAPNLKPPETSGGFFLTKTYRSDRERMAEKSLDETQGNFGHLRATVAEVWDEVFGQFSANVPLGFCHGVDVPILKHRHRGALLRDSNHRA